MALPIPNTVPNTSVSFSDIVYRSPMWVCLAFAIGLSLWYIFLPDIIPLHNGFAWEGEYYRTIAINLDYNLFVARVNSYSIQRILPFVILHEFFELFGITFQDRNLILWMQLFNMLLGVIIVYVWHRIATILRLSLTAEWVGYFCLLAHFAFAKYDLYIPFTTDRLSATMGLLSLYFYLQNRTLALWLNALLSLAVWPTALAYNILLLMVPRHEPIRATSGNRSISALWALGIAGLFAGLFVGVLYIQHVPVPPRLTADVHPLLPVGIVLTAVFLFYTQFTLAQRLLPGWTGLWPLAKHLLRPRREWLYVISLLVAYVVLTRVLGDASRPYLPFKTFLINTTFAVLQRPLQFLVSHGVYYGLSVLIIALFWPRVLAAVQQLGLGLGIMFMVVMVQAINSETRQLSNVLPLLALIAAVVANTLPIRRTALVWTAAILLLISKMWLPFNWFDPTYGQPADRFPSFSFVHTGIMLEWPFQVYFMNQGPWISNKYLVLQGLGLLLTAVVIYKLFTNRQSVSLSGKQQS
ncbi:hypothetical protein Q5H92_10215 [Hymenobacter sp. M29]|uniref:Glycosyltransferase RgtA/B/C/D-like domain-containing protein n=1 Tax=Hymenobacter mellowenesis TaxID=3063995 RepID=A0ABT9AA69_9BACT|nr:hypothetical protein [Hymenobacter sp. M29]MDO7846731.1 hypothetical protein [Hymenobacter sp. M29]